MSRLRQAAALFVEAGRAVGCAEQCLRTEELLAQLVAQAKLYETGPDGAALPADSTDLVGLAAVHARQRAVAEDHARSTRTAAERALLSLEHPGASLARRFLRAARAARGAWAAGG